MKKSSTSTIAYIVVFVLLVGAIGAVSIRNLVNYYVNDVVDYNEWTADLGSKFETDIATSFFEKMQFINANGAIRRVLGQQEMNGVVKLNNGYLVKTIEYVDDDTLNCYAQKVNELSDYLEGRGIDFVYVMSPYTSAKYDTELPEGVIDYGNYDADRLVSMMRDGGTDVIDIRETMYEDGINPYDMMYKTDHHWTTEAGLYAYGKIEDYIVNVTGCEVDERISDPSQYDILTYEKWHLGSNGQRTGRYYAGIDDFRLYVPKFDTIIQNESGEVGKMQDLVYDMTPLTNREYTSRYTYDDVLDKSYGNYKNLNCANDVKVFVVTDSFGKAVNPFLMMGFSQMNYYFNCDYWNVEDYINLYDPDVVVFVYYTLNATRNSAYCFDLPQ